VEHDDSSQSSNLLMYVAVNGRVVCTTLTLFADIYSHLVNVPPDLIPCSTVFIHGYLGSVAVPRAPETV
jgi:hypothetical protein